MKTEVFRDTDQLYLAAANYVLAAIKKNPKIVLGLAAGNTPIPLYKKMVEAHEKENLSFSDITTFNLDEYVGVDQEHPASFYRFTRDHLFDLTDIDHLKTHGLNGVASDLKAECDQYENLLKMAGGIDLQILGLGPNGHIGFNEPGSDKSSRTRLINLSAETKSKIERSLFFDRDIPTQGLTIGVANILEAKKIILIATGASKANAVKNCFSGKESAQWPASFLQSHKDVIVLLDGASAK